MCKTFRLENLKGVETGIFRRVILKLVYRKYSLNMCTGFSYLRVRSIIRLL